MLEIKFKQLLKNTSFQPAGISDFIFKIFKSILN